MNAGELSSPPGPNPGAVPAPWPLPPCVLYEDEHLLVVHKPAGWNTHAPSPWSGEGLYDWLRHREPRWADLAIVQRLDKDTSGVMVFGKTAAANRRLTEQFTRHEVRKRYVFWSHRRHARQGVTIRSSLVRAGSRYLSQPPRPGEPVAETRFEWTEPSRRVPVPAWAEAAEGRELDVWPGTAWPVTGRTHQIRAQAAAAGFPILGDRLYGGLPWPRLCLHAAGLEFRHPVDGQLLKFEVPADFSNWPALALRQACIEPALTDAYRLVHGAADGRPGCYVDRLGPYLLCQSSHPVAKDPWPWMVASLGAAGVYHKLHRRRLEGMEPAEAAPRLWWGKPAPSRFVIRENGLRFELSFEEGYSVGLFLDQRDNRRRVLTGHVAAHFPLWRPAPGETKGAREVLNTFAYTCGFSVAAARAGARVTSVDLSHKYLEWGRRNFQLNGLDPSEHEFVSGDVRDWLRRYQRRGRRFDLVLLDPPTFSRSKTGGVFRVEKDLAAVVTAAALVVRAGGVLFVSSNAAQWPPRGFVEAVHAGVQAAGRRIQQEHFVSQPPDFPVHPEEPAHLKCLWLRLE